MNHKRHDNWVPRILFLAMCATGAVMVASSGVNAQQALPTGTAMPSNDAGVWYAPPRQLPPTQVVCASSHKTILIQNPNDTDQNPGLCNVRVGGSRVDAFPVTKKNGIVVSVGQSVSWDIYAGGAPYVISECTNDAGVALGVVCGTGGIP